MSFTIYQCDKCAECYDNITIECPKCKETVFKSYTYNGEKLNGGKIK